MSSHQDYLARRRLTAMLMNPAANMPSVLQAHSYTEVKAFVLETACATASVPLQLRQSLITAETAAHTSSTGLAATDPGKYDLRGLPTTLVENCPPDYPMLVGTSDMLEDGTTPARGNRVPANNTCLSDSSSCAVDTLTRRRWPNDGYSAYSRVPERARHRACNDAACRATLQEEEEVLLVPPLGVSAVLWLDASDASTLFQDSSGTTPVTTAGQYVRLWRDKSSSALAFAVATSGSQQHMWSGSDVLCSGTAGAGMNLTAANADALPLVGVDSTVFLVLRQSNAFNVNQTAVQFTYGSGSSPRMWYISGNRAMIGAVNNGLIEAQTPELGMAMRIVSCIEPASGGVTAWIDGRAFSSANTTYNWTSAGQPGQGSAWLFNMTINSQENPFEGAIAELLVLDEVLNDTARQTVEGHLAWKWGTQSGLPAGHPYRTVQPPEIVVV